ncbi:hypothetical protein BC937DRAFT_95591 [Endogone sp. FLAS-F59071]|nr:hypothetical protein BC937DRAFT_95591 [Endogone sp. FLAS-F59071]|eukprot:RUS13270.1 hypothetical protein BC937DRAFT_95591 [Endogone sp. FLAS-F59071]
MNRLIQHLKDEFPEDLDDDDLAILKKQKVKDRAFLELTKEELLVHPYNMPGGPATVIAKHVQELKAFELLVRPRTTTTFYWNTNIDKTTIQGLQNQIAANYGEKKDAVATAKIVISDGTQSITIADDINLRDTLRVFAKKGAIKLTIDLKSQKPYNKWSIKDVLKDVLNSEIEDYTQLTNLDTACKLF